MQANQELKAKPFALKKVPSVENNNWNKIEIINVIDSLHLNNRLNKIQATLLLDMLNRNDSRIMFISKLEVSENKLKEIILKMAKNSHVENFLDYKIVLNQIILKATNKSKVAVAKFSLKYVKRTLLSILKSEDKSRTFNEKNFSVKKFLFDCPSTLSLMTAIGFELTTDSVTNLREISITEEKAKTSISDSVIFDIDEALKKLDKNPVVEVKKIPKQKKRKESPKRIYRTFCAKKCGFFSADNSEFCSKCSQLQMNIEKNKKSPKKRYLSAFMRYSVINWWYKLVRTDQTDKSRCWKCGKKIGLISIRCKCRYYFCAMHRSVLDHKCSFDYKKKFEGKLAKENPNVVSSKIDKI